MVFVAAPLILTACGSDGNQSLGTENPADMTLSLEDFAASWDGYLEAYDLPFGSDRIRIVLDEQGEGTVLFGDGDVLPPPSDPDTAYPPPGERGPEDPSANTVFAVFEQFAYPVYGARLEAARLRLELHTSDARAAWCALQTPFHREFNDDYACLPTNEVGKDPDGCLYIGPNDEPIPVSCAKVHCMYVCECIETSCSAAGGDVIKLDGALDDAGNALEGTLVMNGTPHTVRLVQQ